MSSWIQIEASAGTGKTYQLVSQLLKVLFAGAKPNSILATTFTKKAAFEIKERLIKSVASAVASSEGLAAIRKMVDLEVSGAAAEELLLKLVVGRDNLSVRTIDSFISELAQIFQYEIGLPDGFRVADEGESARVLERAIIELLEDGDSGKIGALTRLLKDDQSVRSIFASLSGILREGLSLWREGEGTDRISAWAFFERGEKPHDAEWVLVSQELENAEDLLNSKGEPDLRLREAKAKAALDLIRRDIKSLASGGLFANARKGNFTYYKKQLPVSLERALIRALDLVRRSLRADLSHKGLAHFELLNWFNLSYQRKLLEEGTVSFDDVKGLLVSALGPNWDSTIAYRLGTRFNHILFDEFQDTAFTQWRFFEPFFLEYLAGQREDKGIFVVGDTKQSIYGWRGGNKALFSHVKELTLQVDGKSLPMSKSFRSAPAIIDCVNQVFSRLSESTLLQDQRTAGWSSAFSEHSTEKLSLSGEVALSVVKTKDEKLQETLRLISRLTERFPQQTIGVITRKNSELKRIGRALTLELPTIRVSREGGTPFSEEPVVQALLSLLTLLDHPEHSVRRYHLSLSILGASLGYTDWKDSALTNSLRMKLRRRFEEIGLFCFLDEVSLPIRPELSSEATAALDRFLELILPVQDRYLARPSEIESLAKHGKFDARSDAKVRLLTAHSAKGLEFDCVILPDLGVPMIGRSPAFFSEREFAAAPPTKIFRSESEEFTALFRELEALRQRTREETFEESLSVLYVMITRARQGLFFLCDQERKPSKLNFQQLLIETLGVGEKEGWNHLFGEAGYYSQRATEA